jgi:alpha-beta hydrolase superfamily lysophospholipase
MRLQVIHRPQLNAATKGHLVLIHGACMGAWVWEDNFVPFFHQQGYEVHAISLRGHAGSPNEKPIKWTSIMDYKADLLQYVSTLEGPIFVIGHSMGGFTIQHAMNELPSNAQAWIVWPGHETDPALSDWLSDLPFANELASHHEAS